MVKSKFSTVQEYLDELPDDRRKMVAKVRSLIRKHLPKGYRETMNWGMICYEVPLEDYPNTYNKQPLMYAALASQKNHYALYLSAIYADSAEEKKLKQAFETAGKKLDMGKSCVRFRSLEDVSLDALGHAIAAKTPQDFIKVYEAARKPKAKKS